MIMENSSEIRESMSNVFIYSSESNTSSDREICEGHFPAIHQNSSTPAAILKDYMFYDDLMFKYVLCKGPRCWHVAGNIR